MKGKGHGDEA
jgi:hypothetical protein